MIQSNGYALPMQKQFIEVLKQCISSIDSEGYNGYIFNFRDPDYSYESGGYHPVEVAIDKTGEILYITDFAYFGLPPMVELDKELDFDFEHSTFQQNGRIHPIGAAGELFAIWQSNFTFYFKAEVFNLQISNYG